MEDKQIRMPAGRTLKLWAIISVLATAGSIALLCFLTRNAPGGAPVVAITAVMIFLNIPVSILGFLGYLIFQRVPETEPTAQRIFFWIGRIVWILACALLMFIVGMFFVRPLMYRALGQ